MGEKDSATRLMSGYGAVMSTIAAFRSHSVEAGEGGVFTLDPETKELLATIAEANAHMLVGLADIFQAILDLQLGVQGFPPNADYIVTTRVVCTLANTTYPVPEFFAPEGFRVLLKAWPLNAVGSLTYVATNPAPNPQMAWPLIPNESLPYGIKNTSKLWVFSNVAGSQAVVTVEQRT